MKISPYAMSDTADKAKYIQEKFKILGLSQMESAAAAETAIEIIFDFMKEDDELYETSYWANSSWTNYFLDVRKEIIKINTPGL